MALHATTAILCLLASLGGVVPAVAATDAARKMENTSEYAALPDAPLPTYAMLQFGSGPGSVGEFIPPAKRSEPAIQSCIPNASTSMTTKMSCAPTGSPFRRYLKNPLVAPLTPRDKFILATKDTFDPFNLLTIAADATYSVESNAHSIYGPGLRGTSKYAGVNFTEDMTGEYIGTFIICSLAHQDPHYHREPNRSILRRIFHAVVQVVWTQSDTGRPLFNYANVVGSMATTAVGYTFVPGQAQQGWGTTSEQLALAFASSPSGNLVTEFVPDIASHINLHVVIFQRILNMVATEEGGTTVP